MTEFESDNDRMARVVRTLRGETPLRAYRGPQDMPQPILMNENGRPMSATEMARSESYEGLKPAPRMERGEAVAGPAGNGLSLSSVADAVKMQWNGVWRNLFGGEADENTEKLAYQTGKALGLSPQALLDDPDLLNEAAKAYQGQRSRDFLQGKPFTPKTLKELYPEVDPSNTVAASMALRDYNDVLNSRRTVDAYSLTAGNSIAEAWRQGLRDYESSMIMAQNMDGTLSDAETEARLRPLISASQQYENVYGKNDLFVGATVENLANMVQTTYNGAHQLIGKMGPQGAMMLREVLRYAPAAGAAAGSAMAAAGVGAAGVPLAVGTAVSGLGIVAMSTFLGSYKQMAAQNYWSMKTKRDATGRALYTKDEAIARARTQAMWQAGMETIGAEIAVFGPIQKAFGKQTAEALIRNTMARNKLLTAGRAAMMKSAAWQGTKQLARGAGAEILEEGLQQAVADIDETVFGNDAKSGKDILWNAVEAMVQAAPAAIGMALPGAGLRGGAQYKALRMLTGPELHDAVEEYKRENEKAMTVKLVEDRESNHLYKRSPEVYAETIQNQMARAGKDTLYVDAASAAETEEGRAALSELVDKHVATEKEVTDAVASGAPLELKPGVYMQEVSEGTAQILADHATYDKGGRTLADIREARRRMKAARDAMAETRNEREQKAAQAILDRDFQENNEERAAMEEVLSDDIYDVKGSLGRAIDRVKEQIAQLTDVEDKIAYIKDHRKRTHLSNVGIIDIVGEGGQYESRRVSVNEGWYSKFYKENKKAPGIRDAYDIACDEALEEIEHTDDPEAAAAGDEIRALRNKLETLEGLTVYVDKMDRDDLITRAQMSDDAYREIYVPALRALSGGNPAVAQAARDSALIYAKMAEALHEAYHIPYANIAKIQTGQKPAGKDAYLQTTPEGKKLDRNELNVTELTGDEFGPYTDIKELREKAEIYFRNRLQGGTAYNAILGKIRFEEKKNGDIAFTGSGRKKMLHTAARKEKLFAVKRLKEIIANANVMTESASEKEKSAGKMFYYLHGALMINGEKKYVVVTVETNKGDVLTYKNHNVFTEEEYKKIESDVNAILSDRLSRAAEEEHTSPSSTLNVTEKAKIYKSGNIYRQMAEERADADLVVYHNTTADKLMASAKLGGLPMPSLAVTKKNIPFANFGEITLIGTKDMVAPESGNDVWSRDAYTTRFPEIVYKAPKEKNVQDFKKDGEEYFKKVGADRDLSEMMYHIRNRNRNGAERAAESSMGMKLRYVEEEKNRSVKIPMKDKGVYEYESILGDPEIFSVMSKTRRKPLKYGGEAYRKLSEKIGEKMDDWIAALKRKMKTSRRTEYLERELERAEYDRKKYFDENEILKQETVERLYEEVRKAKEQIVDEAKLRKTLDKYMDGYKEWVKEKLDEVFGDPYVKIGNKMEPATLENIVSAMKKKRGAGKETDGFLTDNAVLAVMARKFTSIDDMKSMRDMLEADDETAPGYSAYKNAMEEYRKEAAKDYNGDSWDAMDEANAALAKAAASGKRSAASIAAVMKKAGFRVTANSGSVQWGIKAIEAAEKVTTDYFEAKPQRAVGFSEFSAAVVPKGTSREVTDFLKSQGLSIVRYDPEKDGDRQEKTQRAATRAKVYFQTAWHGSPYSFDQFDLGKIGSGEGNAAHGWGLYFAKNREISQAYKEVLRADTDSVIYNGKEYHLNEEGDWTSGDITFAYGDPESLAIDKFMEKGSIQAAIEDIQKSVDRIKGKETPPANRYREWLNGAIALLRIGDFRAKKSSTLFKVEIPENDVLLDEQKTMSEQDHHVLELFTKAIEDLSEDEQETFWHKLYFREGFDRKTRKIRKAKEDPMKAFAAETKITGESAYECLGRTLTAGRGAGAREASLYLNKHGIKGITYEGRRDGRCFVVFDDQAVAIIDRFNQEAARSQYRGAYNAGENVIHLFDAADQSTVIHEAAHFYLSTLEDVAGSGWATREAIEDLETIRKWAGFSDEHMAEYAGTDIEHEFAKHADAIKDAKTPEEKRAAEERFIQERFARGFERYLMTGKAPTKELKGAFRRFKAWLTKIYQEMKRLGLADPPEDVAAIFDKMVATQEEIDAWAAEKRLAATDLDLDYSKTEKENIQKWAKEVKEAAKEKALQQFMAKATGDAEGQFEESLRTMRPQWREELLAKSPVYQIESLRGLFATDGEWRTYLAGVGYDEKTFEEALQKEGGPLEARLDRMEEDAKKQFAESALTPDTIRQIAEAQLASPEGRGLIADMEASMMKRRINQYIRTATVSMMQLDRDADIKQISRDIRERNGLLTEEEKHRTEKGAAEERAASAEAEKEKLRGQLTDLMKGLKEARRTLRYDKRALRTQAEWQLSDQPVSKATNWKWWDNKAQAATRRAAQAVEKNDWQGAAQEKYNEIRYAMMSRVARENEQNVKKALSGDPKTTPETDRYGAARYGILGIVNRIGRKEDPVLMKDMSRYFVQHMAYQLGLTTKDAIQPVNGNGQPVPFTWKDFAMELNPTQAMAAEEAGGVYLGDDVIAGWLKALFEDRNKTLVSRLTYAQFQDIVQAIKAAYTTGRREYEGNTLRLNGKPVSMEKAVETLVTTTWTGALKNPRLEKLRAGTKERITKALGKAVNELTLPEILFERLGPEWYELFYETIDRAAGEERTMAEKANDEILKNVNLYTRKEWQQIRSEKIYVLGKDENGAAVRYTKENLLAMALNWGNRTNRSRLAETMGERESVIEDFLFQNLTEKDWDFVEGVWAHIDSYWSQRNAVQDHLYGVPLGKTEGIDITLSSGRKIRGMYYPIKYDQDTSVRTAELAANEIAQQAMQGVSTFTLGMGSTKRRAISSGGQNVRMDLDVYLEHVQEAVHHITMREATVDVYKLITSRDVKDALVARIGVDEYNILKQWAADQWHSPIDKMNNMERFLMRQRKKMTFAAMAFRASTALLNATNIFPMMERMGAMNAVRALGDMYLGGDYVRQRAFVMEKSSFMRGRRINIDRDLMQERRLPVDQNTWKATAAVQGMAEEVNKFGYAMIVETDFALSLPQWMYTYRMARAELSGENMTAEEIDKEAVRRADKAVRETFGSGEMKDRPAVVKGKYISQFLPFYSYTSLVMNQFIRAGYDFQEKGRGMSAFRAATSGAMRPLVMATLFWWFLPSIMEAAIREGMARATGDDEEDYWQRLAASMAGSGPVGGIPFARDIIPYMAADAMGVYRGDGKSEASALSVIDQGLKVYKDITSDKKTWVDTAKDATRMGNRVWKMSDTMTDGFWSLIKLVTEDTDKTLTEIVSSLIFDRDVERSKK